MFLIAVAVLFPNSCDGVMVNDPQGFIAEVRRSNPASLNAYNNVIDIRTNIECAKDCLIANQGVIN